MDGVLADFDRGVREVCGMETPVSQRPEIQDMMWERIRKAGHFYRDLEPMPGAVEMFRDISARYGERVEILTGIPKPKRGIETASEDKKIWIEKYFGKGVVVHTVLRMEKQLFAHGKDFILIDDLNNNIKEWEYSGGTGILYEGNPDEVAKILDELEGITNHIQS